MVLYAVDLDDDEAVLEFINQHGALEIYDPFGPEIGLQGTSIARRPYPALSAYPGFDYDRELYDEVTALSAESNAARAALRGREPQPLPEAHDVRPTIQEFRWAARCMKDLVQVHWCLREQRKPTEFDWENPLIQYDIELQRAGEGEGFWRDFEMEDFLSETLELGLSGFSPRVVTRDDLRPRRPRHWAEQFAASNDLWAVCCLELFNHIAQQATYKVCANERCGRPFVHQHGRSEYGQRRRAGVRFCSNTCARAQAQRAYKRRARGTGTQRTSS